MASPSASWLVGHPGHRDRLDPDLRVPQVDQGHPRRADGGRVADHRRPVLCLAPGAAPDRQLDDPEHAGLRRLCGDRDFPVGHPPRARAFRTSPVLPLFLPARSRRRDDRGVGRRVDHACRAKDWGDRRDRARDRTAQLHRERHPARRHAHLRPAGHDLPAGIAAARWRRHHPGRTCGRGGLLPAA